MRRFKRIARIVGFVVLGLLGVVVLAVLSIFTPIGRPAVRAIANHELASLFKGRIDIGALPELHWNGRLHATNVTIRDPQGRLVADGGVIDVWPVRRLVPALWNGLRGKPGGDMPSIAVHLHTVRLLPDAQGGPSILDAIGSRTPSPTPHGPPSPSPTLRFGSIDVAIDRIENALGGVRAEATALRVHVRADLEPLAVMVDSAETRLASDRNAPVDVHATFAWHSHMVYRAPHWEGVDTGTMNGVVDLRSDALGCHAEYHHAGLDSHAIVSDCHASPSAIDLAAGQPLGLDIAIPRVDATQSGTGPWNVVARALVDGQVLDATASAGGDDATVDLTTHSLDIARIRSALPRTDVTGTIHVERHTTHYVLDTNALHAVVADMTVPPVHVAVNLVGRTLTLEQLTSTPLGLTADGHTDLDHPADATHLALHAHTADVGPVGPVRSPVRGRLDLDVTVDGVAGHVVAQVDGAAREFAGFGVHIGSADMHTHADVAMAGTTPTHAVARVDLAAAGVAAGGATVGSASVHSNVDATLNAGTVQVANGEVTLSGRGIRVAQTARVGSIDAHATGQVHDGHPDIDLTLRARGVVAANQGPLAIDTAVHGDPLHALDGTLRVDGTSALAAGPGVPSGAVARTAFAGPFSVRLSPDAIDVALPHASLALRGAEGTVAGEVRIPRGAGSLGGHVTVHTSGGGRAEVLLAGEDIRGQFTSFPVEWAARAAGLSQPLGGTIDGDLSLLTRRAGAPRGTIHWRHGHAPYVGDFELALTADHTGAVSSYRLALDVGAARDQHVVATVQAVPPTALGNTSGWLRGLREADVQVHGLALQAAEGALPTGLHLGGRLEARVTAHHANPAAPVDLVLAFDARNAQLGQDARVHVPVAIQRIVPHPLVDAMVVPLRARGAVCTRVEPEAPTRAPLSLDIALGREAGAPVTELATACEPASAEAPHTPLVRQPLFQARGELTGPWYAAAMAASREASHRGARPGEAELTAATHRELAAAHATMRVDVGPIDTERWIFTPSAALFNSALAKPSIRGSAGVALTVDGSLDRPAVDLTVTAQAHEMPQLAGRDDAEGTFHVHLAPPRPTGSILDVARLTADGRVLLHVRADANAPATTATAEGHADFQARVAQLLDPRTASQALERQDIAFEARGMRLAWIDWANQRGLDGLLTVRAHHGSDAAELIRLDGAVTDMHSSTGPAAVGLGFSANVRNGANGWRARLCAVGTPGNGAPGTCSPTDTTLSAPHGGLMARVDVPLSGNMSSFTPDMAGITANVVASSVRLEPLSPLAAVSPVERLGGVLDAQIAWRGSAPREVHGQVHVHDGTLWIEGSSPVTQLALDLDDNGRHIAISRMTGRIGHGTLSLNGTADLGTGDGPMAQARLALETRHLPIEMDGNPFGEITTRADITATAFNDHLDGRVQLHNATVLLPSASSHSVQDMGTDPHVRVVRNGQLVSAGDAGATASTSYPISLALVSDAPITAVRNDLYVAVRANITMHQDPRGMALEGGVTLALAQSWFELLGKRFYIDRAAIRFDGSTAIDPVLHVAAHYDAPSAGRIDIAMEGRVTDPTITFTSEQQPDADQSTVLSMLVLGTTDSRGGSDQQNIADQAGGAIAGLLTGLTANALTSSAREHFDFLPRVIADPGTSGLGSGRYGAGATTLNGRLYVEGTYGAATSYGGVLDPVAAEGGNSTQEFHGLVEYSLSPRWSISGQYGTSNRFGADIYWTPMR